MGQGNHWFLDRKWPCTGQNLGLRFEWELAGRSGLGTREWASGNTKERGQVIPHDQLGKEGRKSGELACAFIYVPDCIKGEGASSPQGQSCPERKGIGGHLSLLSKRFQVLVHP